MIHFLICRLLVRELTIQGAEAYVAVRREALLESPFAFASSPDDNIVSSPESVCEQLRRTPDSTIFGSTFDPKGTVAMISLLCRHRISLIDVKTYRILSEYKTASPLAGILFDEKELKAYAYRTFLPYE